MRLGINPSIANRIFVITAILLVLMAVVTAVNAVMSTRVGGLITTVGDTYLPAYGNLARSHIRALEQSFMLRRAAIEDLKEATDEAEVDHLVNEADALGIQSEKELTAARELIAKHILSSVHFGDDVQLGRLDAHVEEILRNREDYKSLLETLKTALRTDDRPTIEAALVRIDGERDKINDRLEEARAQMLRLAQHAVNVTREDQQRVIILSIVTFAIAIVIGLILATRLARNLVNSMRELMSATEAIELGKYDSELPVTSNDEIGKLAHAFNVMIKELKLKEKIRDTFGKYVDPKVVAGLIEHPELTGGAGDRRTMTIFFCDMKGFTPLSDEITPSSLVTLLNRYFTLMSEEIRNRGGVVDKYMGDAVMAFWGPPFVAADQQGRLACEAALAQVTRFETFKTEVPELLGYKRFIPAIGIRIGIATGDVIVGNIGSAVAMNYTVMGDAVNTASRLEGVNRVYGTYILVNEATAQAVRGLFLLREIDRIQVVGRSEAQAVFEVLCDAKSETADMTALAERYAAGLHAYRARDWVTADAAFRTCLEIAPEDGPAHLMIERVARFADAPPAENWDGAYAMKDK
jgi:class 3 adenylate cyclase